MYKLANSKIGIQRGVEIRRGRPPIPSGHPVVPTENGLGSPATPRELPYHPDPPEHAHTINRQVPTLGIVPLDTLLIPRREDLIPSVPPGTTIEQPQRQHGTGEKDRQHRDYRYENEPR